MHWQLAGLKKFPNAQSRTGRPSWLLLHVLGLTMVLLLSLGCASRRPLVEANEGLRISRVVLFQNGLAYVERRGQTAEHSVKIRARRDQVDDVLKSLTVVDRDGANVASVRVLPAPDDAETIDLEVALTKASSHDLSISYVAEMSGWRPTYRLVAGDDGQVRFQGLAVVDNRSGELWQDIDLSLSTDLPLSFRYALQSPSPTKRPELTADGRLVHSAATQESPNGVTPGLVAMNNPRSDVQAAYATMNAYMPEMSRRSGVVINNAEDEEEGQASTDDSSAVIDPLRALDASQGLAGALLEGQGAFNLGEGESGLVPFVDRATEGRLVLLYKPASRGGPSATRPYHAVLFRNPLDAPLLTGPVAVYSEDQFLGDGVTGTIAAGHHAFVAFAMSPEVQVEHSSSRGEDDVRAVAVTAGTLRVELQATLRHHFRFTSSTRLDQPLYLFVEAVEGYQPREAPDGTISTEAGYYIPATASGGANELDFVLLRERSSQVNIAADPSHPWVPALVELLGRVGSIDTAPFVAIADRVEELRLLEQRSREDLTIRRQALSERREALQSLRDVPANHQLRRRIAASVAEGVTEVDELTRAVVAANAERSALRAEWYDLLRELTINGTSTPD